jgi:hypothetical protein
MRTTPTMNEIRALFRRTRVDRDLSDAFDDDSFTLYRAAGNAISVVSGRRSQDPLRPRDMEAYAAVLAEAGFNVVTTSRNGRVATVKVLPQ